MLNSGLRGAAVRGGTGGSGAGLAPATRLRRGAGLAPAFSLYRGARQGHTPFRGLCHPPNPSCRHYITHLNSGLLGAAVRGGYWGLRRRPGTGYQAAAGSRLGPGYQAAPGSRLRTRYSAGRQPEAARALHEQASPASETQAHQEGDWKKIAGRRPARRPARAALIAATHALPPRSSEPCSPGPYTLQPTP